jgi:hypothetical protein
MMTQPAPTIRDGLLPSERLRAAVTRADLAHFAHSVTIETITSDLRAHGDLPAEATRVVIERHEGRVAKYIGTDLDVDNVTFPDHTIEQSARTIARTYGATYIEVDA